MNRIFSVTSTLLTIALLASACKGQPQKSAMPPLHVEAARATSRNIADQISFSTSTEPIRSVTIEPRVDGYLQSIDYNSGEPITAGKVIFRIDPTQLMTDLASAEAAMQSAEAALVNARNNYNRAIPLAQINAISATALDEYTATYRAAEATLKSAEQSLKNAELNISYTTISSPLSGLIAESPAAVGDYVGPATKFETLTTISQIDTLTVPLAIPTSRYVRYATSRSFDNQELLSNITLILPDSTLYPHKGLYDYTQKSASSENSTIVIMAKFPNPDAALKSKMFARVSANIGELRSRLMVPQRAVTQMQGVNSVWIIKPDSSVTFRTVELGGTYSDLWQITEGIAEGEMVATSAQLKLHEGAKVVPITEK